MLSEENSRPGDYADDDAGDHSQQSKKTKMVFSEEDQLIEMEVNAGQDDFFLEDAIDIPKEYEEGEEGEISMVDTEDESDGEEMQENIEQIQESENNNASIDTGGRSNSRNFSEEEKEEFITEVYDRAMEQMQKCVKEVMDQSGIMQTAQMLQEQLKKGTYITGGGKETNRTTTINIKNSPIKG